VRLASIHTYPIKGCHRLDQDHARVEPWGLAGDRRWLITDDEGKFLTQREEPALTHIRPSIVDNRLRLAADDRPTLTLPVEAGQVEPVTVWSSTVDATRVDGADEWLADTLRRKARLYYLDDPTRRAINERFARPEDRVSFADGYPLLLANAASLTALNDWLVEAESPEGPLPMTRFRPNVVVEGAPAWAEDDWLGRRIRLGSVVFRVVKPCDRCVVTTTDQETGARGHEPLRILGRHRNIDRKLLFGMNMIPDSTGGIAVGDEATILG
jgi:uncharacterized protein YcbX